MPLWIIDTSSLLNMKKKIAADKQWAFFRRLEYMVERGELALPRQVIRETSEWTYPDVPGAWVRGVETNLQHPADVDYAVLKRVMAVAGQLVELGATKDVADPYVVALALQLKEAGHDVVVVSDDFVDRLPLKLSIATACNRLGTKHDQTEAFLKAIGGPPIS